MRTLLAKALLLLAACSAEPSVEELVQSARMHLDSAEPAAAAIQLKRALNQQPESPQIRLLLGRALLQQGDGPGALVELQRARDRGASAEQLSLDLARAHLAAGQVPQAVSLLESTTLGGAEAQADARTMLAEIYLSQGDSVRSRQLLEEALSALPGHTAALLSRARLDAVDGRHDDAWKQAEALWSRVTRPEGAGLLKAGLLLNARKDREGALAMYREVIAAHPRSVTARAAAAQVMLQLNQVDAAKAELLELQKLGGGRPETLMLQALIAYGAQDYTGVRETTARLLATAPSHTPAMVIAAAAEMQAKQWVAAQAMLARLLKAEPSHVPARRMMAEALLQVGQSERAVEVLRPVVDNPAADAASLKLAGSAHLRMGQAKQAEALFQRALKARPDDAGARTALAMTQMAGGESSAGLARLEAIARSDVATPADLALVSTLMARNDAKGALAAVEQLQRKLPKHPLPDVLRGRVLMHQGDSAGAEVAFQQALRNDPATFDAIAGLGALDMQGNRVDAARQRFEAYAKSHPNDARAPIALAQLERQVGAPAHLVAQGLRRAVAADPAAEAAHAELVSTLIAAGEPQAALEAAQAAASALPEHTVVLELLGVAQMAAGESELARSSFKRLVAMRPGQVAPMLRLADAHLAAKDIRAAAATLREARQMDPDNPATVRSLALVALAEGRSQDALALARQLQAKRPREAAGHLLEADIATVIRKPEQAVAALRAAQQRDKSPSTAQRLHASMLSAGDAAGAERMAADWLREHPQDAAFRYHLGSVAVARSDWASAEGHFRAVVQQQPRHAAALNNVAWLLVKQGKAGARALAEQAHALAPDRPPILDTLALALESDGQLPRAVQMQRRATELEPRNGDYRLRLAELLVKSGDKKGAREELTTLQGQKDFMRQDAVSDLLRRL